MIANSQASQSPQPLTMVIFSTKSKGANLLFRCASRGRHADVPYYQSVDQIHWDEGFITYARLDASPVPGFKVCFAGNLLITTESFQNEVMRWLHEWGIKFTFKHEEVPSPQAAMDLVARLRQEHMPHGGHGQVVAAAQRKLRRHQEAEDRAMFGESDEKKPAGPPRYAPALEVLKPLLDRQTLGTTATADRAKHPKRGTSHILVHPGADRAAKTTRRH